MHLFRIIIVCMFYLGCGSGDGSVLDSSAQGFDFDASTRSPGETFRFGVLEFITESGTYFIPAGSNFIRVTCSGRGLVEYFSDAVGEISTLECNGGEDGSVRTILVGPGAVNAFIEESLFSVLID